MSETKDDGGPAFPQFYEDRDESLGGGMTLRDWFAGMAMSGLSSSDAYSESHFGTIAEYAYKQADAMLEARTACTDPLSGG